MNVFVFYHQKRSLRHKENICFRLFSKTALDYEAGWTRYQSVLVSMSSAPSRRSKNEHAMRKHVQPYGDFQVAHLGMSERFDASLRIQDLFYLGDTRSAADFDIFPPERLCLGCGIRSDETFCPVPPQDRAALYNAAIRLM